MVETGDYHCARVQRAGGKLLCIGPERTKSIGEIPFLNCTEVRIFPGPHGRKEGKDDSYHDSYYSFDDCCHCYVLGLVGWQDSSYDVLMGEDEYKRGGF